MRFAVHWPGSPVASPRSHGVPRRDVDGRVHIGVAGVSAGSAPEGGLALARLRVHLPARRAALARERGTDVLHPARRLVLQAADQQAPSGRQDAPVQGRLARTFRPGLSEVPRADRVILLMKVFDSDRVEPPGDIRAGLLGPVLAPVGFVGAQPGESQPHPAAAVRAAPRPGQLPLQPPPARALPHGQAGDAKQVPSRQGRGHCHAPVDAHDLAVTRCRNRSGITAKATCQRPARSIVTR